ncbi:MAG: hypothetical protein H0W56_05265 [Acidothermales bacterium]|nr:hypothetical protein [Acidothermales bacterium]
MYDEEKLDEVVLALLHLNSFPDHGATRAWKGFDWDALNRLHDAGLISDPRSKAKSIVLTEEGARRAEALFERHFGAAQVTLPEAPEVQTDI